MGMVTTAFILRDQMSQTLRQITPQVTRLTTGLGELHRASESMFNPSTIGVANGALSATINNYNTITYSARSAGNAQRQHNQEIYNGVNASNSLANSLRGALNIYMAIRAMKFTLGIADEFSSITARLGNIKDSLHTTNSFTQEVADSAMRARGNFASMAQTVSRIGYTAKGLFSNDELIQFTENVQKGFVIAGTTAHEASNAMLQLSQAMASGRMQGDELRSTLENNSAVSKALAEHLGVSIGQLKEMGADGEITAEIMKDAILNATDEINRDFEKMPLTFGQSMENIKTQAMTAFAPVLWVVQQIGVGVASAVSGIISTFSKISPVVYGVATVAAAGFGVWATAMLIAKIASFDLGRTIYSLTVQMTLGQVAAQGFAGSLITAFMTALGPIILLGLTITSAVGYLTTLGMTLTQVFEYAVGIIGSVIAVLGFLVVAFSLVQLAINAVSIATLIWSAITATNPIVFLIMAIVAGLAVVIGALYQTGVTTSQVLGFMGGMFSMLYATIKNILKNLWNGFASIAEFFINVWRHPIVSVVGLFAHMVSGMLDSLSTLGSGLDKVGTWIAQAFVWGANKAIGAINWITEALNKIPGVNLGKMDLIADPGKMTGAGNALKKASKDIESDFARWANEKTGGEYKIVNKFEMEDLGDAYNKGYDWGSKLDLGNFLVNPFGDNVFGDKSNDKIDNWGASNPLTGGNKADKETAANTAKMAKTMEATQEDLKYLRDIAEQNTINNSTVEVKVDITNHNTINSNLDLDGVVDHLNTAIREKVAIEAEGLYI